MGRGRGGAQMTFEGIIDGPSTFAPIEEWREYLAELKKLGDSPEVSRAISEAEATIAAKKETEPPAPPEERDDFADLLGSSSDGEDRQAE